MNLSKKSIATLLDHVESKLRWIQVLDREDARVLATLEHCPHAAVPHAKERPGRIRSEPHSSPTTVLIFFLMAGETSARRNLPMAERILSLTYPQ